MANCYLCNQTTNNKFDFVVYDLLSVTNTGSSTKSTYGNFEPLPVCICHDCIKKKISKYNIMSFSLKQKRS